MKPAPMRIVVLGLSLSSSWGNGHATTYRALIKGLAKRGHKVLFLERETPWYSAHRDAANPGYCRLEFYGSLKQLHGYAKEIERADAVIVGSYVPDGIDIIRWVLARACGTKAFYDIDTPVTMARVEAETCHYLAAHQIKKFDVYLSFTGGPVLRSIASSYGAPAVVPLFCSVDTDTYRPRRCSRKWHLGYLGTYSPDRQPALERLLIEPARSRPDLRFVIAGAQYPSDMRLPENVDHFTHIAPTDHPVFYSSLRWALNITRSDMVRAGYSPSVRLFEAGACGTPVISDTWAGLDELFVPGREILLADTADLALAALALPEGRRASVGKHFRRRVLREHTAQHRAAELVGHLRAVATSTKNFPVMQQPLVPERNRSKQLTLQT